MEGVVSSLSLTSSNVAWVDTGLEFVEELHSSHQGDI